MDVNNKVTSMEGFNPGNHLCCIYNTNEEMYSLIIPYFIDGLQKGNKCLFILGDEKEEDVIRAFNDYGFDISYHILKNNFSFSSYKDIYLKDNTFNVTTITSALKKAESEALNQGYSAFRIVGSTSAWAIEENPIITELNKYETVVNEFIDSSYIIATCLYKEPSFKSKTLANVLLKHRLVYLRNKLVENIYFTNSFNNGENTLEDLNYEEMTKTLSQ